LLPAIRNFALVFFGALLLHVSGTWIIPLVDRDEPRFAEAAREMRERGDLVIPYFNDKYRFDKPALIYWTQIASYSLFGENDFAARFPSAVAAALTAMVLFAWGRRIGGDRTGWWAALVFSLCLQVFVHAKASVADMWLVFFGTVAYWAGYELLADFLNPDPARESARRPRFALWRIIFYVALGLGFLAKGPLAWLPLAAVISTKLFVRQVPQRTIRRRTLHNLLLLLLRCLAILLIVIAFTRPFFSGGSVACVVVFLSEPEPRNLGTPGPRNHS